MKSTLKQTLLSLTSCLFLPVIYELIFRSMILQNTSEIIPMLLYSLWVGSTLYCVLNSLSCLYFIAQKKILILTAIFQS